MKKKISCWLGKNRIGVSCILITTNTGKMEQAQFDQILARYRAGTAKPEEIAFLEAYYKAFEVRPGVHEIPDADRIWAEIKATINSRIDEHMPVEATNLSLKAKLWPRVAIAASIAVAVIVGVYFYNGHKNRGKGTQIAYHNDVAPGKDGATLTLANGQKILINHALAGNIATQTGVNIRKTANGEIIYEVVPGNSQKLTYNTLSTTRGQQTKLRLPDGTLVFLNSASSLKYPTVFGEERKVELAGEAYFEVAHHKQKPFKVLSSGQEVKVLGTHFNINSYDDEEEVRTTLLEGSVEVSCTGKAPSRGERAGLMLKPNQQAVLSPSGTLSMLPVNAHEVVAWTHGKFIFEKQGIKEIMRTLSRWYNVDVVYEGEVKDKQFAGTLSRMDNISKVLDMISYTKAARFKVEGRSVTVMP